MHDLVLEFVRDATAPVELSRMPLDDGALVACFAAGGRRQQRGHGVAPLLWVAKVAYGVPGCRRLRHEARALGQLEPVASALRLPRLLGWRESTGNGGEIACLIQSGVAGEPMRSSWRRARSAGPPGLHLAGAWLRRFQGWVDGETVAAPRRTLAELAAEAVGTAEANARRHTEWARLLLGLAPVLEAAAAAASATLRSRPAHGDFWSGNVLARPPKANCDDLAVIDWSGLTAGSALDDLLTWVAQSSRGLGAARANRLECWQRWFFAPGPVRQYLRAWAAEAGYDAASARLAFYLFLQRRLGWELGLDLQTRSEGEQAWAGVQWNDALEWLRQAGHPDPFTAAAT